MFHDDLIVEFYVSVYGFCIAHGRKYTWAFFCGSMNEEPWISTAAAPRLDLRTVMVPLLAHGSDHPNAMICMTSFQAAGMSRERVRGGTRRNICDSWAKTPCMGIFIAVLARHIVNSSRKSLT